MRQFTTETKTKLSGLSDLVLNALDSCVEDIIDPELALKLLANSVLTGIGFWAEDYEDQIKKEEYFGKIIAKLTSPE